MQNFSICPARRKSIHQGRKLELDLSLMWDESSVRCECWQSLEIHVNFKVNSGYSTASGFYIFIRFEACSVAYHLEASISLALNEAFLTVFYFMSTTFHDLWRVNTDWTGSAGGGGVVVYQYTGKKFAKIPKNTKNSSKYTQVYFQVYFIPEIQRKWYRIADLKSPCIRYTPKPWPTLIEYPI